MTVKSLIVTAPEAGQKLLQYLSRALAEDVPRSALMRWIRTGQVRVDGRRAGPFDRLDKGQIVRVPPFAVVHDQGKKEEKDRPGAPGHDRAAGRAPEPGHRQRQPERAPAGEGEPALADALRDAGLPVVAETDDYLVLAKPVGLPVHPGSGWTDSVQTRLAAGRPPGGFVPTIAHRLDRDTSGVLLVAKTFLALTAAHRAFKEGLAVKEYLAWVRGRFSLCPVGRMVELRDLLAKTGPEGGQKVVSGRGKPAWLDAWPLVVEQERSLLRLRLHTGRTHQIRAQLATRGHPLVGDAKYGGGKGPMLLHAWRLTLHGLSFVCLPSWSAPWTVPDDPAAM